MSMGYSGMFDLHKSSKLRRLSKKLKINLDFDILETRIIKILLLFEK